MNGNGTQESPYEITTYAELVADKEQGKYYKLMNNIDCHTEGNTTIKTTGEPTDASLYAQIDLNGKSIICPLFDLAGGKHMFRSLHMYNGNIFDIYFNNTGTSHYPLHYIIFDDISISIHWSRGLWQLVSSSHGDSYFNRCYVKIYGTFVKGIYGGSKHLHTDCTIEFADVSNEANYPGVFLSCNYCYICGKMIMNTTHDQGNPYGILTLGYRRNYCNQNLIDLTIDNKIENPSALLSFYDGNGNVFNNEKIVLSNADSHGVSSADMRKPSVLISKGM